MWTAVDFDTVLAVVVNAMQREAKQKAPRQCRV